MSDPRPPMRAYEVPALALTRAPSRHFSLYGPELSDPTPAGLESSAAW
jgi:hypothetical protein